MFSATVDWAAVDKTVKMNHLKALVRGKAEAAIAGMRLSGQMYDLAWSPMERHFGRQQIIVNAQLKQIHSHPYINSRNSLVFPTGDKLRKSSDNVPVLR